MPDPRSDHDHYVTKIDWLVRTGRDDLVDEIADQFERPAADRTEPATVEPELRRAG